MDSLKPTEVIVSFTSFSQWLDSAQPAQSAASASNLNVLKTGKESKDPKTPDKVPGTAEPTPSDVGSVVGGDGKESY